MDHRELRAILARYPASEQPTTPLEALGNAGGLSGSQLWRYEAGVRHRLLRCWPVPGPDAAHLGQIHQWLHCARALPFVPVPRPMLDGQTLVDRSPQLWQVEPWVPGEPLGCDPGPEEVQAAFTGLASLHQALAHLGTLGPSPGLTARLRELRALRSGGFAEFRRAAAQGSSDPFRTLALRWVEQASGLAARIEHELQAAVAQEVRIQPCLRDARPEHFLFSDGQLTGLVDFGGMGPESVAADLARLMSEWFGPDRARRREALDAYGAVRPLEPVETTLIAPFERSAALLGPGHWVRWVVLEGRRFDDPTAPLRGLERGVRRLENLARGN